MPRLAVATGIFHPEPGGPATYLHELLPELQARAWELRLLTYGDASAGAYPYPVQRIPRRALPLRVLAYARAARPLLRWADLVYTHTIDLPLWGDAHAPRCIKIVGDQAWERCVRKGWVSADCDIDAFQTGHYGAWVAQQRRSRSQQVRAMAGVIVPSEYLRQMVIGWGVPAERVRVIYNALPPHEASLPPRESLRAELGWHNDWPVIVTAARLTAWKGIDHLIHALARLPDVRLVVAGDGEDAPRLRALAAPLGERVRFVGRVPRHEVYRLMRAADLFALYSGYEGLPHTLLEALRLGTPVIASAKGGNPEVVQHGINGLLVPYVDVAALAEALREGLNRRAELAAQAQIDEQRFSYATMVNATHAALLGYLG